MLNLVKHNVEEALLPLSEFAQFLQLRAQPTGEVRQDLFLNEALQAALLDIESRTQKALLRRLVDVYCYDSTSILPYSPLDPLYISAVRALEDHVTPPSLGEIFLRPKQDIMHLEIKAPLYGPILISIVVGHTDWAQIEGDLRMAVFELGGHLYRRHFDASGEMRTGLLARLLGKYKKFRLS